MIRLLRRVGARQPGQEVTSDHLMQIRERKIQQDKFAFKHW